MALVVARQTPSPRELGCGCRVPREDTQGYKYTALRVLGLAGDHRVHRRALGRLDLFRVLFPEV